MPRPTLALPTLLALLALSACATTTEAPDRAQVSQPVRPVPVEVPEELRIELAREAQLQTPLVLAPEETGAPAPFHQYAMGLDAGAPELVAGGVDISPDVRVWQRFAAGSRQIYGPRPGTAPATTPPVRVAP
jgi:hypothetical protein